MNALKCFVYSLLVKVCREGSCAQYGMMAAADIDEGEVLFQVPRDVLLHPGTSAIKGLLEESKYYQFL